MQRTPPKKRLSFVDVPLPPSPGESGGDYESVRMAHDQEEEDELAVEVIEERMAAARKLYADLREMLAARGARKRASAASRRSLNMEFTETAVSDYHFENQESSPLDCGASFCSTASLVDTVKRRPAKRGFSMSPETGKTTAEIHPAPECRGVRTAGKVALDTPKRRKTAQSTRDMDEIRTVGNEGREPLP